MTEKDVQVNIRMPASLKAMLDASATIWGRSLTAEIVTRLDASFVDNIARALRGRRRQDLQIAQELRATKQARIALLAKYGEPQEVERAEQDLREIEQAIAQIQAEIASLDNRIKERSRADVKRLRK